MQGRKFELGGRWIADRRSQIADRGSRIVDCGSKRRLLHLLSSPGRAMRPRSADLPPQALMRARCPGSLLMNRRREATSPYRGKEARLQESRYQIKMKRHLQSQLNQRTFWKKVPAREEATSSNSSTSMFGVGCWMFDVQHPALEITAPADPHPAPWPPASIARRRLDRSGAQPRCDR